MISYVLDLVGLAVSAISGALAAIHAKLDLFGVIVIAALTAIGGGTLRDLLLNRHPIFWIVDPRPLLLITLVALLTAIFARMRPVPRDALVVADALALALFAMSGAQLAEGAGHNALVVILMGTMTGVGGGVIRDVLTARIPLILRQDIYATAAIAGIGLYLAAPSLGMARPWAFALGMSLIVAVRLSAIRWKLQLPAF